jgi:integrase
MERLRVGAGELTAGDSARPRDRRVRPEDVPTTKEVRRVLAELDGGCNRALILTAACTGMRPGELLALSRPKMAGEPITRSRGSRPCALRQRGWGRHGVAN